jgi:chaperone BCS1
MDTLVLERTSPHWPAVCAMAKCHDLMHDEHGYLPRPLTRVPVEHEGATLYVQEKVGDKEFAAGMSGEIRRHRELVITGAAMQTLVAFVEAAWKAFTKVDRGKVSIYTWDYRWEKSHSQDPRDPSTLHLPKKALEEVLADAGGFLDDPVMEGIYRRLGIPQSRVYMLHGLPGTGKTTLAHTLAGHLGLNVCLVELTKEMSDQALRRAFQTAPERSMILFEDLDCLFQARKSSDEALHNVSFSGILNAIDGAMQHSNKMLVVITCNNRAVLDKAITRRVDYFIEFDLATSAQLEQVFRFFYPEKTDLAEGFARNAVSTRTTINIAQKFLLKHFLKGPQFCVEQDYAAFNRAYRSETADHLYS